MCELLSLFLYKQNSYNIPIKDAQTYYLHKNQLDIVISLILWTSLSLIHNSCNDEKNQQLNHLPPAD